MSKPLRVAMWSGPRNISTALMRSWGNRPDTAVCDEPLYAHYLQHTGLPHPGAEEVIARHEPDWRKAVASLVGDAPGGKAIYYQKHMAHHLLPHIDRGWLCHLTHAFLIREPREMLASLTKILPDPAPEATGLPQQVEIFAWVRARTGRTPPVVDAKDVLGAPRETLTLLCESLGVPFTESMLSWPPGPRETDGVWARHWYQGVEQTTSFRPHAPRPEPLPPALNDLLELCESYYDTLHAERLRP